MEKTKMDVAAEKTAEVSGKLADHVAGAVKKGSKAYSKLLGNEE
jgi:hypothetical protein